MKDDRHARGTRFSSLPENWIRDYYERNTRLWIGSRGRGNPGSYLFHRKLWGPGVTSVEEALLYIDGVVADILSENLGTGRGGAGPPGHRPKAPEIRVADLGCGAGGTAFTIASRLSARVTGISVSGLQVKTARERAEALGLQERCGFVEGDFLDPPAIGFFHGAVAIESFAHTVDHPRFFASAARLLLPGGILVICDDFLAEGGGGGEKGRRWVGRFERGWRLGRLLTAGGTKALAGAAGFTLVSERDLTPLIRKRPLVVFLSGPLGTLPSRSPFLGNIAGGVACRRCTSSGFTEYRLLVFTKTRTLPEVPSGRESG